MKLKASIKIEGETDVLNLIPEDGTIPLSSTSYIYNQPFSFKWEVPDRVSRSYNFTFYLKDMAGNENSSRYGISIDNQPPNLSIKNITTLAIYITPGKKIRTTEILEKNETKFVVDKDIKFRGTALNIYGTASTDVGSIKLSKMDENNTAFEDETIYLKNYCAGILDAGEGCFQNGNFSVVNYPIGGLYNQEIPYYLLFEVKDEAENIAYYTLLLVSDSLAPIEPVIDIRED
jgi:hypothetical protein